MQLVIHLNWNKQWIIHRNFNNSSFRGSIIFSFHSWDLREFRVWSAEETRQVLDARRGLL